MWFRQKSINRPSDKGVLSKLATKANSFVLVKFERKISGQTGVRLTLFISNEDMGDIIKIVRSLENSNLLIDGKTWNKIKKVDFLLLWCHLWLFHW